MIMRTQVIYSYPFKYRLNAITNQYDITDADEDRICISFTENEAKFVVEKLNQKSLLSPLDSIFPPGPER